MIFGILRVSIGIGGFNNGANCCPIIYLIPQSVHDNWRFQSGYPGKIIHSFFFFFMLSVLPFGKHDSGTQAKYPGSKGLLIDPIYFDPAKMEKFV